MKTEEGAPFHFGSLSGKICPISGSPKAPKIASTTQWSSTSPTPKWTKYTRIIQYPLQNSSKSPPKKKRKNWKTWLIFTIRMSLTTSIMRNIDAPNNQRVPMLKPMEIEPVTNPERQRLGASGWWRGLRRLGYGGRNCWNWETGVFGGEIELRKRVRERWVGERKLGFAFEFGGSERGCVECSCHCRHWLLDSAVRLLEPC